MDEKPPLPPIDPAILAALESSIFSVAEKSLDTAFEPSFWVLQELGISLFDNQIEILESVINHNERYVAIIGARSSGKSFSVGVGAVKLCIDMPGLQIGVFAPKAGQASRFVEEIYSKIFNEATRKKYLDLAQTTKSKLVFKNGSYMLAQSAAIETLGEGYHFDIAIIDESQHVPDLSFSQRIVPMLASSRIAKTIQLGVPLYKNHFFHAFNNPQYKKLRYSWLNCPKLYEGGTLRVEGKDYPKFMVDQMPRDLKQGLFPNNPDLWYESVTKMSTEDFKTQYIMDWLDDINLLLSEEDQKRLLGTHLPMDKENPGDYYYFGLDFAGGAVVGEKIRSDFTALSIWRRTNDNRKEKVFACEWKGDLSTQMHEITSLINPKNGLFRCKGGLADYGNMGAAMVDLMKGQGIPIDGVFFAAREPQTGKNYKNAMYEHYLFELRNDRIKFPALLDSARMGVFAKDDPNVKIIRKHFEEWCVIERYKGVGFNDKISAPSDYHDDGPSSDIMAIWAADKSGTGGISWTDYRLPNGARPNSILSMGKSFSQGTQIPGMPGRRRRQ